jgi:hypothetical protein
MKQYKAGPRAAPDETNECNPEQQIVSCHAGRLATRVIRDQRLMLVAVDRGT